ncbi:cell wall-binding repeat-containing protein [Herbiconiux sp. VKM Ac-2851]|uniref:cell wall-binding repeat-containing protein n=1 Tax=Herbiconiux sp. VKM Ac-2851 TaxID=2739025 RepID=UPI001563AEA1|nr:cell wall-binding repeat-containing protein [Herbiconiux sp. VKM Ac-2851]NQX35757.1 cell wall-binding repeat-containing protein [Herbiconiux sp. VKM Ac-2851]
MKKALTGLAATAAAALTIGGLTAPAASAAENAEVLSVDFSQTTGEFRGGATGTLYGFGDQGAPTQALIDGAHITNSSQKAPYGTQHPSGDALKIEDGFFAKHGEDLYIYIQDYYPDWAYNGGARPGDDRSYDQATGDYTETPNGVWDYLEVVEFVTEAVATQSAHPEQYVFIPFNEPDGGNWYPDWAAQKDQFLGDWQSTYEMIESVYERHGLANPVIGGPGDYKWERERSADLLDFSIEHDVLPDVFIWHELGIENLATFRSNLDEYRALEAERELEPIPVNITEYGMLRDMGVPGQLIQWFSMFEDEKVDAQTAYWNYAGNFSDNSARVNSANAGWWMFKWYGDLAGSQTVQVTPPELNVADTLQGIGAVDTAEKRATVLYGGTGADVRLELSGLDTAVFGNRVDVEVREVALSGAEGVHGTPRVVAAYDGAVLSSGGLDLTVPGYDRYAGYQVVITPEQTREVTADTTWAASIEAEDTALTSVTAYDQDPTAGGGWKFLASGSRDVGSFNRADSKADWTVTVPRDGTYRFQVVGSAPGEPGRQALFVDDGFAETVQYTADLALNATSRWQYRGSAEVTVPLTAGEHVLSLRASEDGSTVLPGSDITLDKFLLTDVTDGEPTVYPASTLRYDGGAGVRYENPDARGFASIAGADARADVYANAWEAGYHDVAVDYASTAATTVDVTLNGRAVARLSAPDAGHWRSTARLHLSEGINEIELRSAEGILLDRVTTTRAVEGDAAATTIEAEDAQLNGGAALVPLAPEVGSNASGAGYVGNLGNGAGSTFDIARQPAFAEPGAYDVVVHYSNAETSGRHDYNPQVVDRRLTVTEAGSDEPAAEAYFRYTYSWNSFWNRTIPVTLSTTDGTLSFGNAEAWAPNVDRVTIAPALVGIPVTEPTATPDPDPVTVDRIGGADRFEVAVNTAQEGFPDGAGTVYVVSGEVFADALSAAPAAAADEAPILLTRRDEVPSGVLTELDRLDPRRIVIVGGEDAVGAAVASRLAEVADVSRIRGADRFETSRAVATRVFAGGAGTVVLATGSTFADALSAGAAVGSDGPVVLIDGAAAGLDEATTALVTELGPDEIAIAGGPLAVSDGIQEQAAGIAETVRLGGADRFESSRSINAHFFGAADRVLLATGQTFPDALAGSAFAPRVAAALFTVPGDCVPTDTLAQIEQLGAERITLLGGTAALSPSVESLTRCG